MLKFAPGPLRMLTFELPAIVPRSGLLSRIASRCLCSG